MDYEKTNFGLSHAYRVANPRIVKEFLDIINRAYGVRSSRAMKFPGAQPCSIMRSDIETLKEKDYVVAEKTDGTRYLLLCTKVNGSNFCVLCDRSISMWVVNLMFDDKVFDNTTIFDGEMVKYDISNDWTFQIFDLICSGREARPADSYKTRMKNARYIVNNFQTYQSTDPFQLVVKRFFPIHDIAHVADAISNQFGMKTDGLVFTPNKLYVKPFRNRLMFKWKERASHTIDVLLRLNRKNAERQLIHDAAAAHHLKTDNAEYPQRIQINRFGKPEKSKPIPHTIESYEMWLKDSDDELTFYRKVNWALNKTFLEENARRIENQQTIVECSFDQEKSDWKIEFIRSDRRNPNTEFTVSKTLDNIRENITLQEICDIGEYKREKRTRTFTKYDRNQRGTGFGRQAPPPAGFAPVAFNPFQNNRPVSPGFAPDGRPQSPDFPPPDAQDRPRSPDYAPPSPDYAPPSPDYAPPESSAVPFADYSSESDTEPGELPQAPDFASFCSSSLAQAQSSAQSTAQANNLSSLLSSLSSTIETNPDGALAKILNS